MADEFKNAITIDKERKKFVFRDTNEEVHGIFLADILVNKNNFYPSLIYKVPQTEVRLLSFINLKNVTNLNLIRSLFAAFVELVFTRKILSAIVQKNLVPSIVH